LKGEGAPIGFAHCVDGMLGALPDGDRPQCPQGRVGAHEVAVLDGARGGRYSLERVAMAVNEAAGFLDVGEPDGSSRNPCALDVSGLKDGRAHVALEGAGLARFWGLERDELRSLEEGGPWGNHGTSAMFPARPRAGLVDRVAGRRAWGADTILL